MKLANLADVRSGSLMDREGGDALFVMVGGISASGLDRQSMVLAAAPAKSASTAMLNGGDVVVALRGARNWASVVPDQTGSSLPLFASLDVASIRPDGRVHPAYLAWYMNSTTVQEAFEPFRTASAAPRLPLSALKELDIPLPPVAQQIAIAALGEAAQREAALTATIQKMRHRLIERQVHQLLEKDPLA
jgi:hypothetical protein